MGKANESGESGASDMNVGDDSCQRLSVKECEDREEGRKQVTI